MRRSGLVYSGIEVASAGRLALSTITADRLKQSSGSDETCRQCTALEPLGLIKYNLENNEWARSSRAASAPCNPRLRTCFGLPVKNRKIQGACAQPSWAAATTSRHRAPARRPIALAALMVSDLPSRPEEPPTGPAHASRLPAGVEQQANNRKKRPFRATAMRGRHEKPGAVSRPGATSQFLFPN
jgi:hypothetical protein